MTIIFIANTLGQPLCYKRIREFVVNGYNIKAFGFKRDIRNIPVSRDINIQPIADIPADASYLQRIRPMRQAIGKIINMYGKQPDTLFYYFQLDIAMIATSISNHKYIYEEYDLAHTYIKKRAIRTLLEKIDRRIIRNSQLTIFTSKGFAQYYFGNNIPNKIIIVPNKLDPQIEKLAYTPQTINLQHIRFAYIGIIRHKATYTFAKTIAEYFPQHELHFYGPIDQQWQQQLTDANIYFHGTFTNPQDLPDIYQQTDIVLAPEYDIKNINGKYAEPNKLYEAIYFRTPIITNPDTRTAEIINKKGIGFVIDFDTKNIINFVQNLTEQQLADTRNRLNNIPQHEAVNHTPQLFEQIKQL